jgi:hypothetical protein
LLDTMNEMPHPGVFLIHFREVLTDLDYVISKTSFPKSNESNWYKKQLKWG